LTSNQCITEGNFVYGEKVVPFGIGKRVCIGQSLAEREFFMFATGLFQRFNFKQPPNTDLPSYIEIYPEFSITRVPPHFEVVLEKQFEWWN
jgi:cytochrome P450